MPPKNPVPGKTHVVAAVCTRRLVSVMMLVEAVVAVNAAADGSRNLDSAKDDAVVTLALVATSLYVVCCEDFTNRDSSRRNRSCCGWEFVLLFPSVTTSGPLPPRRRRLPRVVSYCPSSCCDDDVISAADTQHSNNASARDAVACIDRRDRGMIVWKMTIEDVL